MNHRKSLNQKRRRRVARTRARIFGTARKPRLAVFRSNRFISAQLVDDERFHTLVCVMPKELQGSVKRVKKSEQARLAGELLGKKALVRGIKEAVFDRRAYRYHGRVRAFAEGARRAGLKV